MQKSSDSTALEIKLPPLHDMQQQIRNGMRRFTVVRAGRQSGKSWLASGLAIEKAFNKPNQFIMILAPTYRQTEAIYGRIRKLLKPLINRKIDGEIVVKENKADHRLDFFNGSTIMAATADQPDRLRGFSIHFVIFDEAAMMPDNEVWVEVIRPALAATHGEAMFITTPKGKSNWFYDLWRWAEDDIAENGEESDWALFHFKSTDSPYFPESEAEAARALGENVYLQEYEAEFVATKNRMISEDQFHYFSLVPIDDQIYISYATEAYPEQALFRAMTVDLAVKVSDKSDYTVFVIGDITSTGVVFIRDIWHNRIEGHIVARKIAEYAARHHVQVIYVENVAFQLSIIQELIAMGVTVKPLIAKGDKIARATLLGVRMEAEQVAFPIGAPWLPATIDEVTTFPDGAYDDRVDTLAYMAHVAQEHARFGTPGTFTSISLDKIRQAAEGGVDITKGSMSVERRLALAQAHKKSGGMALEKLRGPLR